MSGDGFLSRWAKRKAEVGSGRRVPAEPPASPPASSTSSVPPALGSTLPAVGGTAATAGAAERPLSAAAAAPLKAGAGPSPAAGAPAAGGAEAAQAAQAEAPGAPPAAALTLDDVNALTPESSFAAYVNPSVDARVRNAAMKKLFTDPHYNVMDGLDTYIEDYGIPDPIPMAMLRQMNQSKFLGLFAKEEAEEAEQARLANEAAAPAQALVEAHETSSPAAPPDAFAADAEAAEEPPPLAARLKPALSETSPHEDPDLRLQQDDGAGWSGAGPGAGNPAAA